MTGPQLLFETRSPATAPPPRKFAGSHPKFDCRNFKMMGLLIFHFDLAPSSTTCRLVKGAQTIDSPFGTVTIYTSDGLLTGYFLARAEDVGYGVGPFIPAVRHVRKRDVRPKPARAHSSEILDDGDSLRG